MSHRYRLHPSLRPVFHKTEVSWTAMVQIGHAAHDAKWRGRSPCLIQQVYVLCCGRLGVSGFLPACSNGFSGCPPFSVLHILNSSCHFSNTFGPRSPEILVFSRFPGIFSWPFPLLFSLRDVCKGKLSAFTRTLIQKPGGRTCGSFLCMGVDVHGGVHAGKAQQLSDIFKDAPP